MSEEKLAATIGVGVFMGIIIYIIAKIFFGIGRGF